MKLFIVVLGLIITIFAEAEEITLSNSSCDHSKDSFRCVTYISNYDGDTVTVNIPNIHPLLGERISVRLLGIDTPELKTKNKCEKMLGLEAKKIVENILKKSKRIDLVNIGRDKYFRIDADIIADGQDIKQVIMNQKLAYSYAGNTKSKIDWCKVIKERDKTRQPSSK